jgi:hypothetical protein
MIDNRHCTEKDLRLLEKETNAIKRDIIKQPERINVYLDFIARFDLGIAQEMRNKLSLSKDTQQVVAIINENFDKLKQNIIVDIFEHR